MSLLASTNRILIPVIISGGLASSWRPLSFGMGEVGDLSKVEETRSKLCGFIFLDNVVKG